MKRGKKNLICKYNKNKKKKNKKKKTKKNLSGLEPMRESKMTTTVAITS